MNAIYNWNHSCNNASCMHVYTWDMLCVNSEIIHCLGIVHDYAYPIGMLYTVTRANSCKRSGNPGSNPRHMY